MATSSGTTRDPDQLELVEYASCAQRRREEPVSAYDYAGHARLSEKLDTPIATGEMLSSVAEVSELVKHRSVTLKIRDGRMYMPQAPGLGLSLSDQSGQWRVAHAAT